VGKTMIKVEPSPKELSAEMLPSWRSIILLQIESSIPDPSYSLLPTNRSRGLKAFLINFLLNSQPVS
jgi:hypothetical protein